MRAIAAVLLCLLCNVTLAADFRPFTASSKAAIERAHAGRPFVLAFWSLDCSYCAEELQQLRRLRAAHPSLALVLVSTDSAEVSAEAGAMLDQLLAGTQSERWMFSGSDAEHLYFAVDRRWHGELPRAYFYDGAGKAQTVAGKAQPQWLEAWAKACASSPACSSP